MSSPEALHQRMNSLVELRGIVRTMKSLSAASIRQFEQAVEALAEYYRTVELGLQALEQGSRRSPRQGAARGTNAIVVFGSNHGLCGAFNHDVVQRLATELSPDARLLAVGACLGGPLEDAGLRANASIEAPGSAKRITVTVREMLMILDKWRSRNGLASLSLCYNHHTRRGAYRSVCVPVLPVDPQRLSRRGSRTWPSRGLPMHTLSTARLRTTLIRQYMFVCAFRACAESQASEHGSRLLAMQAAEKNMNQRIDEVSAAHRRVRQANITAELLDVVSGYEALSAGERTTICVPSIRGKS